MANGVLDPAAGREPAAALGGQPPGAGTSLVRGMLGAGAIVVLDQAIVSATSFFTVLIIARLCSPEEVGVYYLAWTVIVFVSAAQNNLISIPYTVYSPRCEGHSLAAYAGSALVHQLLTSLVVILGLLALAGGLWLGGGPPALRPVAWAILAVIPFLLLREYARRFAFAHLCHAGALALDILVAAIQLGCLLLLGYLQMLSVPLVYYVMGGACAVAAASWLLLNGQPMRVDRRRVALDWQQNWAFGKWALACQLAGLAFYLLPWILAVSHGEAETGLLAAGNTLVGLANLFVMGLNNFLTPKAAHAFTAAGVAGLARVLRSTAIMSLALLGAFCLAAVLAGDYLAVLIYGAKYHAAGPIIAVLALVALVDGLNLTANNGLWALNRPSANLAADLLQLIAMLAAAAFLVVPLGALGVAVATLVGRVLSTAVRWLTLGWWMACSAREPNPV